MDDTLAIIGGLFVGYLIGHYGRTWWSRIRNEKQPPGGRLNG